MIPISLELALVDDALLDALADVCTQRLERAPELHGPVATLALDELTARLRARGRGTHAPHRTPPTRVVLDVKRERLDACGTEAVHFFETFTEGARDKRRPPEERRALAAVAAFYLAVMDALALEHAATGSHRERPTCALH